MSRAPRGPPRSTSRTPAGPEPSERRAAIGALAPPPAARRRRDLLALATAALLHALLLLVVTQASVRRVFPEARPSTVELSFFSAADPPPPDDPPAESEPEPEPQSAPPARAPPQPRERDHPPPRDPAAEAPPAPVPTAPVPTAPPASAPGESLMRLPPSEGAIGRVLGTGKELGPSLGALEGALDLRADGPMSDGARAALNARRALQTDLADDAVTAGLADDYFRELRNRVETNWRPEMKQLNDGGESVSQVGMMRSFLEDRSAWDEMWKAYLDLAKMYSRGERPKLEPARIDRIRELMRSRKGMFRFHAISEVVLTQAPDGKVLTVELPLSSGHPGIDDGVRDAISTAVKAMADSPPARVHHGRSFSSTWRLRATWTMVPPTALLTGAGFDITPKGLQVDVPFDIKLKTHVLLLRTDAVGRIPVAGGEEGSER
jgi:hypothetical protein